MEVKSIETKKYSQTCTIQGNKNKRLLFYPVALVSNQKKYLGIKEPMFVNQA